MKYFEVAPLTYIGSENNVLTYQGDEKIQPGFAVKITIRNKEVLGVVVREVPKPTFKTKEIIEYVFDKPVINENLLTLAFWIADYYSSSLVSVLQTMIPKGITKKRREISERSQINELEKPLKLNSEQEKVFRDISKNIDKKHLIFGVTGSGKTEIYMQFIQKVIDKGQQAIVLVPEVSLTPQTLNRFRKRFGTQVTLLHSYLKETERYRNWKAILDGEKQIIIGSRSALFAPCEKLGLIVIDEEHETSYKQDQTPRYQTLHVAKKLTDLSGAGLVLGSATPDIETFYTTKNEEIKLHVLYNRVVQTNLPPVEIVDMRHEYKYGNTSIFSEKLQQEISRTLKENKQIILFLNRRGMSTFVSCRDCGYVETCPNCEISLTYHLNSNKLECHHCGFAKSIPVICPECKSLAIKYFGSGTERVEQEIKRLYGDKITIARMDKDTTKTRGSHEALYNSFVQKDADILIGTQMITKGLDLENVGLVGVISADTILNFPDYTANERTFDLLTQVAGRTGRGQAQGQVIIQTYNPENFAIQKAAKHDYLNFYEEEIKNREELSYPPFAKLIKLVYNNIDQTASKETADNMSKAITEALSNQNIEHNIIGPSPAFIPKMANKYYYQISLKLLDRSENNIIKVVKLLEELTQNKWQIDVEPGDLL